MEIPFDTIRYEAVKNLTVNEIINLCKTQKQYQNICKDDELWRYLILRDFRIVYDGSNPLEEYKLNYNIHKISDIPVDKVAKTSKEFHVQSGIIEKIMNSYLGYRRVGNVYEWNNICPGDILNNLVCPESLSCHIELYSKAIPAIESQGNITNNENNDIVMVLYNILPPLFKANILERLIRGKIYFELVATFSVRSVVEIYDFYKGTDAFQTMIEKNYKHHKSFYQMLALI